MLQANKVLSFPCFIIHLLLIQDYVHFKSVIFDFNFFNLFTKQLKKKSSSTL